MKTSNIIGAILLIAGAGVTYYGVKRLKGNSPGSSASVSTPVVVSIPRVPVSTCSNCNSTMLSI